MFLEPAKIARKRKIHIFNFYIKMKNE